MTKPTASSSGFAGLAQRLTIILCAASLLLVAWQGAVLAGPPAGCDPAPGPQKLDAARPINLGLLKRKLVYYRCTRYDEEIAKALRKARDWVDRRAGHVKKPALVLDIDETSLSNWKEIYQNDFGYIVTGACDFSKGSACGAMAWERSAAAEAIKPTLALFNAAKAEHVTVFFITGRSEGPDERNATEKNLESVGYDGWQRLYMRTREFDGPSVAPFKTWARRDIAAQGYVIIANVGDQWSDLEGGYAERRFKLPNPFYYVQ
jgi:acid phosphatase